MGGWEIATFDRVCRVGALCWLLLTLPVAADVVGDCRQGQPEERIAACTQVIGQGGVPGLDLARALNARGLAHQAKGDFDRAIADYTEAVRVDPRFVFGHLNRGWAHNEKREYSSAIVNLNEAIRLDPRLAAAWNQRGIALRNQGQLDMALADFTQAIRLAPKYARAYAGRGRTQIERHEPEKALADLDIAVKLDPGSAAARSYRGWALNELRQFDKALVEFDAAIRLDPQYAGSYNNRAIAAWAKGDLERALADFSAAIARDPAYVNAFMNRGRLYQERGDVASAQQDLQRVLALPAASTRDRQRQESARERLAALASVPRSPAGHRRVALVIGNARYATVGALANPANDARAVAAALRRLDFSVVTELHDLDLGAMTRALKEFGDHATGADWAVVFFAGHGIEANGTNYLIPVDAALRSSAHVADEAVTLDRVQAKVQLARKFGLVMLDACRNNPFVARMARPGGSIRAAGSGLAMTEPDGNTLVAYSAKHGTVAEDGTGPNSPFVTALVADIDKPGLEVSLLFRRVRDSVRQRTNSRQEPFVYGSLGSELLYFNPPVPAGLSPR